jgi:integrase
MRGSFKKRTGPRGDSWYCVVDLGADPITGKRRQKRVSASTKRGCEALALEAIQEVAKGTPASADTVTVSEYLEQWLAVSESTLRPATHRRYRDLVRLHLAPVLGQIKLGRLSALDIQRLHADRLAAGLSPSSVYHLHYVLHRALAQAVKWDLVARNVTELVDAPRRVTPDVVTWNASQAAAFLTAGDKTDLAAFWRLAVLTGMRRGEMLGLKWEDVDFERGVLSVRRTLSRGKGGAWELGKPKTKAGRRAIALPGSVVDALKRHRIRHLERRLELGFLWEDQDFVFTNPTGGPLHVNSLMLVYEQVVKAAGVPRIRLHDLRHTSATLMMADDVHPKIVQERLGHSNISMTLDRYSHVTKDMQRQAADRLDALVNAAS